MHLLGKFNGWGGRGRVIDGGWEKWTSANTYVEYGGHESWGNELEV